MIFLDKTYFQPYSQKLDFDLKEAFENLANQKNPDLFEYLTESSAVYSSNIEGNSMDLNSFMNTKLIKEKNKPKEFIEIMDLVSAYHFAQTNELNEKNFLKTHEILAKKLLPPSKCGKYRQESVGVFGSQGLVYLAVEAENVQTEMGKLFEAILNLTKTKLTAEEVFYFASMIHLHLAQIHPFADGNGRACRLLEKWFIASLLGKNAWLLPSEKFYKENLKTYYQNINLGVNYYEVDYKKSLPFLLMLANAVKK